MPLLSQTLLTTSTLLFLSIHPGALLSAAPHDGSRDADRPDDIIDVSAIIPGAVLDLRYTTAHNFVGRPIPGYQAPRCLLTRQAAVALAEVQAALIEQGYQLKLYDCYRPQQAVDAFVAWAEDLDDQRMKTEFYPNVDKQHLFRDGYIASKSGHSRGSTVDLTILPKPAPPQPPFDAEAQVSCEATFGERFADNSVDMGTGFDCFSPLSHTLSPAITGQAHDYRLLLKGLMEEAGFKNLAEEWWHFTLRDEPYPETYFDFPIR
ncbi:M15 family metallopeptidase [Lamprobacter modestohalophilus]|uniref:M15 family metallopeptidase n=1 Tax=Lamprobacter modestohalophilus TaxID=1064514 RepID=UPI002ADEE9F3|nr:M15 family metallopeptidase [Lamprobacter modestohalophilus]MEA1050130.1 M15 family metallopeptidase [Lamprobacter modestohalophilus]